MGTLVAEVAALGLAVAFTSPVSVVTVIVLLSMPSGRRRALAFVCGWLIAIAAIGAIAIFVLHGQNFGSRHHAFFRSISNDRTEHRNTNGVEGPGWTGPGPLKRLNDAYALDWVSTVSPGGSSCCSSFAG